MTLEEIMGLKVIKLDLGCGERKQPNYVGIDIIRRKGADYVCDARKLPFPNKSVHGIISRDLIECFKPQELKGVLNEWYRVLRPGSRLIIQTVDFKQVLDAYLNHKCECWNPETRTASKACTKCKGKATLNDERFRQYLYGSIKDEHNIRRNVIDEEYLTRLLEGAGFKVKSVMNRPMRVYAVAVKLKKVK